MTDVAIKYCPKIWGDYKWQLMHRNDSSGWEACGASIDKAGILAMVKPDETIVEEDTEPLPSPSTKPTEEQLACKHERAWYEQLHGIEKPWRVEYCSDCKSVIRAVGDAIPSHKLPQGWPVLKRVL